MRTHLMLLCAALLSNACADGAASDSDTDLSGDTDASGTDDGGTDVATDTDADTDAATDTDSGALAKPTLGAELDRVGRPGINTMLNSTFSTDRSDADMRHDAYNADSDPTTWSAHAAEIHASLAIWDSIDHTCGNQLAASAATTPARYDALTRILVDDRLYVDATGTVCGILLAVELNGEGLQANTDCGGRTIGLDSADALYSRLTIGAASGVTDGISVSATVDTFPFLAAPH